MDLRENMCLLIFLFFFIVDNTTFLKLVFPVTYCFCLDSLLSGCVVAIIVVVSSFSVIITYLCHHLLSLLLLPFLYVCHISP